MNYAILKGKDVVPVEDVTVWGKWFDIADRTVKRTKIKNLEISTVFLGISHSFCDGSPLWFETMIFGCDIEYQERCETWEQAKEMHKRCIKYVKRQQLYKRLE